MQRTMLAAVKATDEQLVAPQYLMLVFCPKSTFRTPNFYRNPQNASQVNLFCIKTFCPQKTSNGMLFVAGQFQCERHHT